MNYSSIKHKINLIVAVNKYGGYAKENKIPWHIPEDLKHFKQLTENNICIMGRNTYEDLLEYRTIKEGEDILPNRETYVITSKKDYKANGVAGICTSLRNALDRCNASNTNKKIFICGGNRLFVESLSICDIVNMTIVKGEYKCDKFFNVNYINNNFKIVEGKDTEFAFYVTYKRK